MFGFGWRSTYEEQLYVVDGQTLQYWRGDGSAWTFTYNSVLYSYSLTSTPDERAQLVMNPATGGFTLTLADGTQRVFNSQNRLAAVIDRTNNQTALAYDSSNRIASVTSPGGATLSFTYGDPNNPMQVTMMQDSVGVVATYTYDSSSRLTLVKVVLQGLPIVPPRLPVHARRGFLLKAEVSPADRFQAVDMVQERGEPQPLITFRCLTYPLQRTGRVGPTRCPGRVLLGQVPFGQTPPSIPSATGCRRCSEASQVLQVCPTSA